MSVPTHGGSDPTLFIREILRNNAEEGRLVERQQIAAARFARSAGLTYREIAEAYGLTEGAIRKMLQRADGDA